MCVVCGCTGPQANFVSDAEAARLAGALYRVADPAAADGALADGRPGRAEVGAAGGEQDALGWGLAPARMNADADAALTALPMNPVGFSVRQQDAVRRDAWAAIDDYTVYEPAPFVGC